MDSLSTILTIVTALSSLCGIFSCGYVAYKKYYSSKQSTDIVIEERRGRDDRGDEEERKEDRREDRQDGYSRDSDRSVVRTIKVSMKRDKKYLESKKDIIKYPNKEKSILSKVSNLFSKKKDKDNKEENKGKIPEKNNAADFEGKADKAQDVFNFLEDNYEQEKVVMQAIQGFYDKDEARSARSCNSTIGRKYEGSAIFFSRKKEMPQLKLKIENNESPEFQSANRKNTAAFDENFIKPLSIEIIPSPIQKKFSSVVKEEKKSSSKKSEDTVTFSGSAAKKGIKFFSAVSEKIIIEEKKLPIIKDDESPPPESGEFKAEDGVTAKEIPRLEININPLGEEKKEDLD